MDYAIMSGGDVGPLGDDAVNQLHNLFSWASRSRRGLLIFIDEAEAFLSSRRNLNAAGDINYSHHALNALLYQTGNQSKKFMLVLATNRPEDIDSAILDRIDVSIHVDLPGILERISLFKLYFDTHIMKFINSSRHRWFTMQREGFSIETDCVSEDRWMELAMMCEGFSGREISKLFVWLQISMMMTKDKILTASMLSDIVRLKVMEHTRKLGFNQQPSSSSLVSSRLAVERFPGIENASPSNPPEPLVAITPRKTPRRLNPRKSTNPGVF
jgi:ATPase family AAA domain-containing protein 3A/B